MALCFRGILLVLTFDGLEIFFLTYLVLKRSLLLFTW